MLCAENTSVRSFVNSKEAINQGMLGENEMKFELDLFGPAEFALEKKTNEIMSLSETAQNYNLTITKEKAIYIVNSLNGALKDSGRIEFGESAAIKITKKLCSSPYVHNSDFEKVIGQFLELFFLTKNDIENALTDDELIGFMVKSFNGKCEGSIIKLTDKLQELTRKVNSGKEIKLENDEKDTQAKE